MTDDFREFHWALENIKLRPDQGIQFNDQVYVEDLHRQHIEDAYIQRYAGHDTLRELVENAENSRPTYTISDYVRDIRRKYEDLGIFRTELDYRDIENIKVQCTSSNCYPRKNYKINFWHDNNDYEEDMLLLKGLIPAKTVAHVDRDEEPGYIIDISELKNMLKDQVDS